MANSVDFRSSAEQIQQNYEKYKDLFSDTKKKQLGQSDYLSLMVEQMKNQDFTNPTDNAEYIAQLSQFSSLEQMQQMTSNSTTTMEIIQQMVYNTNATFAATLIGKNVSMAKTSETGAAVKETGTVSSVKFNGKGFEVVVNGKSFATTDLVEIVNQSTAVTPLKAETSVKNEAAEEEIVAPNYSQTIQF